MKMLSRIIFALAAMTSGYVIAETTHPARVPFTWNEDFRGELLDQFASYPPVQDAGYDPSLAPTSDYGAPGGRALMRIFHSVRTGPARFGFIRRLDLVSSANADLSFSYRFDSASAANRIEIGIAGADGRRYSTTIPMGTSDTWHRAHLAIKDLRDESHFPMPAGTGIQALYLVADVPQASPDVTYRFLIDSLQLQAEREVRFRILSPRAAQLEPRAELFAAAAVDVGNPLRIEAAAPLPLLKADCILKNQDGKTIGVAPLFDSGTHGDRTARDGIWSNGALPKLPERAGVYNLLLHGVTSRGLSVTTSIRIVGLQPVSSIHPRIYFRTADCVELAARSRGPKYAALWQQIVKRAKASRTTGDLSRGAAIFPMLDRVYLLPTLPGYFDLITKAGARIQYNALVAAVTGDSEARAEAKAALLDVMKWKSWAPPWFPAHGQPTYYPAGQFTAQVAFAYDALYNQLSPDERRLIQDALIEKGIVPAYREYALDDRVIANTSNWIAHSVAGALIAAAAIRGDGAEPDLDLYINGLLDKFEKHLSASYLPAGSYGEGISYQAFDLETLGPALIALKRVFGLDYWNHSHVKDSLWYPISTLADPISGCLDMGDTHCPAGYSIAPVVAASHNPVFRWYQGHFAPSSWEDFLFTDDTLQAKPPEDPGSRYFRTKGSVVFRTGWKPDDAILLFRAGPNFNHNHAGQGSFLLRALGENLATDAGYADYYKDPYYDSYFKQTAGHNTVLVDGDPASQDIADTLTFPALHDYPEIANVLMSADVDALDSQIQQVYRGRLKRFTRRIVFLKPDYVIVYDELVPTQNASFDWLLHLPDVSRVTTGTNGTVYSGRTASLAIRFLSPTALTLRVNDGHLPYTTFNPIAPQVVPVQPAILNATTVASAEPIRFLAVLAPARLPGTAREHVQTWSRIETNDWIGLDRDAPTNDRLLFRKGTETQVSKFDSWATDATTWFIRGKSDDPELIAALGVTNLRHAGETWFSSEHPASFSANYQEGHVTLTVYSPAAQTIRIRKQDGQISQIAVEPGNHEYRVEEGSKL